MNLRNILLWALIGIMLGLLLSQGNSPASAGEPLQWHRGD